VLHRANVAKVTKDGLLNAMGFFCATILVSSFAIGSILDDGHPEFVIDDDSILRDVENLTSYGPRVSGSEAERQASEYIGERFEDIGLKNVEIRTYQAMGSWVESPNADEEPIHMHAQIEQGSPNIPGFPDGAAGTGRIQIESTGDLNHIDSFSFLGYSGGYHKHDNQLLDLGFGSTGDFESSGDLTDCAIIVHYDGSRTLADIYKDAIEGNAAVLMIYQEGVEEPPFRTVTVEEDGVIVPFPEAYGGQYYDLLIPFIHISESVAQTFIDYVVEAAADSTKYAILDGNWEAVKTGTRTIRVVTGEIPGDDRNIMIGAHHDSTYLGPGAVDNAIGVSQIIEIASHLVERQVGPTFQFASWGGEELGLLGSQAFIQENEADLEGLDFYINLDSTNLNPSIGLGTLGIETTESRLSQSLNEARGIVFGDDWDGYEAEVFTNNGGGGSDHKSFNSAGFSTVGFYGWKYPEYHLPSDQFNVINQDSVQLVPDMVLQFVSMESGYEGGPVIQIEGLEGKSESWVFPFTIALCAGLATGIGGIIVMVLREITREMMAFMLGMAGGVMLLISIVDLWFEQANEFGFLSISVSFGIGALAVLLASYLLSKDDEEDMTVERKLYKSGILTAIALGVHNFPEGLAMGVAVLESAQYGFVLMIAIALHNIPEGIAVAAPIQAGNGGKLKATGIAMLTGLTEPLGALFALLILGSILTPLIVGISLAFVGGIMTVVSCKELIPQAISQNRPRHMIVGMLFGSSIMQLSLLLLG